MVGAVTPLGLRLLSIAAVAALLFGAGYHLGATRTTAKRDAEDRAAIAQRIEDNAELQRLQSRQLAANERNHADEIKTVQRTAAVLAAQRLRLPASACAGAAQAEGASGGDGAAAGTVLLPERIDANLRALTLKADTIVANCRTAQRFIHDNGFDKE